MTRRPPAKKPQAKHTVSVCINGRLVAPERAVISVDDWGFRYGWGAFESLRVHKRRPLFLSQHLARLWRTVGLLGIAVGVTPEKWEHEVEKTISRARLQEGMINLYWTLGTPPATPPVRIVSARASRTAGGRRPMDAWIAPWRIEPSTPGSGAKTMAYFPNIFAAISAGHEGFRGAIVINSAGYVADGATSSVFVIKNNVITTPRAHDGALDGITRAILLENAHELGITTHIRRITQKQLHDADAILLTSALQGQKTVRRLSSRAVAFKPSLSTREIIQALQRAYNRHIRLELANTRPAF